MSAEKEFNSVEFVRSVCEERGIKVSKLEKDLIFANGYLNPKKMKKIQYDRAVKISEYLGISVSEILTGEKEKPATQTDDGLVAEVMRLIDAMDDDQRREAMRRIIDKM